MLAIILNLVLTLGPTLLEKFGAISPALGTLIADLGAAIPALIAKLQSGGTPTDDELALLQAFQSEIAALQANTDLDPADLQLAAGLNAAVTEALAAYQSAEAKTDPSNLTPLPTDVEDAPLTVTEVPTAVEPTGSA